MKPRLLFAALAATVLASCGQDPTPQSRGAAGGTSDPQPQAQAPREEKSEVATAQPARKDEEKNEKLETKEDGNKAD